MREVRDGESRTQVCSVKGLLELGNKEQAGKTGVFDRQGALRWERHSSSQGQGLGYNNSGERPRPMRADQETSSLEGRGEGTWGQFSDLRIRRLGFKFQLHHLLAGEILSKCSKGLFPHPPNENKNVCIGWFRTGDVKKKKTHNITR